MSGDAAGALEIRVEGRAGRITLTRPEALNALSHAMIAPISAALDAWRADPAVALVLFDAAGDRAFCAGGDISEYPSFRFDPVQLRHFHEVEVWGGLSAMLACDVPVVAAIRGACMGAGLEIASCCDIRIASDSARFGAPTAPTDNTPNNLKESDMDLLKKLLAALGLPDDASQEQALDALKALRLTP